LSPCHSRTCTHKSRLVSGWSVRSASSSDQRADIPKLTLVPCVDGSELARQIFTSRCWSVQPCVRPVSAVQVTAGHNALRGSGPGPKPAFDHALALVGCPDRRIDRLCMGGVSIKLSLERQPDLGTCASLHRDSVHVHSRRNRRTILLASERRREKPAVMAAETGRIDEAGHPLQMRNRWQPPAKQMQAI
jgi:hypothetical protein